MTSNIILVIISKVDHDYEETKMIDSKACRSISIYSFFVLNNHQLQFRKKPTIYIIQLNFGYEHKARTNKKHGVDETYSYTKCQLLYGTD